MRSLALLALLLPMLLLGCRDSSSAESGPQQTVGQMLAAAKAGDWVTYVDDFYGETHKFRDDGDRQMLIERFQTKWGPQVVETLQQVAQIEPRLTDGGEKAVFDLGDGRQFALYRDDAGGWKFHL